jgi:hypothetical protein
MEKISYDVFITPSKPPTINYCLQVKAIGNSLFWAQYKLRFLSSPAEHLHPN